MDAMGQSGKGAGWRSPVVCSRAFPDPNKQFPALEHMSAAGITPELLYRGIADLLAGWWFADERSSRSGRPARR